MLMFNLILILVMTKCRTEGTSSEETVEWIDPHEMTIQDSGTFQRINTLQESDGNFQQKPECTPTQTFSLIHYKRLINFLLNLVSLDDSSDYSGHLNLRISKSDYEFLMQFAKNRDGNESASNLRKIEYIINQILTKSKMDYIADAIITWTDYVYFHFYNRATAIIASCIFLLFISYKLLKASFTIWSVIKYLVFLAWVTDFAFTWINLLKEAEINQMADSLKYKAVPPYCDPSKMSWFQYLWYSISTDSECRNYHQTIYKDVFWSVAPLQVISYQFGIVVYTPARHTGMAIGSFITGMLASLPMYLNYILLPLLLIFVLFVMCILLSFVTRTSFDCNILYLLKFHFGSRERESIENVLSGSNITALINIAHRNMIEDVSTQNTNKTEKIEKCACRDSEQNVKIKDSAVPQIQQTKNVDINSEILQIQDTPTKNNEKTQNGEEGE